MYTMEEVSKHNTDTDCWIVIDNEVWNVTNFLKLHPGGHFVLMEWAGKDATEVFYGLHLSSVLQRYRDKLVIGRTGKKVRRNDPAGLSRVPYVEISPCYGVKSPYWKKKHIKFLKACRKWYIENIVPIEEQVSRKGKVPKGLVKKMGDDGILPIVCGIYPWPSEYAPPPPFGVKPEEWDIWYELAFAEGVGGVITRTWLSQGILGGLAIGTPPVQRIKNKEIKDRVLREVLSGEKRICLCITEPFGGSDVAGSIRCVAKKNSMWKILHC